MPAKLAGYFKRDKEGHTKLRETIMHPKKVPGKLPRPRQRPFLDERKGGKRKSRHQGCLPS